MNLLRNPDRVPARFSLLLVGLLFVLPFLQPVHRLPLPLFYSEWLGFALGLAALLFLATRRFWRDPQVPWVALAPLALAGLIVVQGLLGHTPYVEHAMLAAQYLLWAALLIVLGAALRREFGLERIAVVLAWFLVAGALLSIVAALAQHYRLGLPPAFVMEKIHSFVYGNLGQRNQFTAYLALGLISLGFLHASMRVGILVVFGGVAAALFCMALTTSRAGWLYLLITWLLALCWRLRVSGPAAGRLHLFFALLIPAFWLANVLAPLPVFLPDASDVATTSDRFNSEVWVSDDRRHLWRNAWDMFVTSPWTGAGWGHFSWGQFDAQAATGISAGSYSNEAHNLVLHLLAVAGVLGTGAIVAGLVLWLAGLRAHLRSLEGFWLLTSFAIVGIYSMLEGVLWYSYFLGLTAILLGAGATAHFTLRTGRLGRGLMFVVLLVGAVTAAGILSSYREFERLFFTAAAAAPQQLNTPEAAAQISKLYDEPFLVPYLDMAVNFATEPTRANAARLLELNTRVMRFSPNPEVAYRHALLLALNDDASAAVRAFRRAVRAYPAHLPGLLPLFERAAEHDGAAATPLLELAAAELAHMRRN